MPPPRVTFLQKLGFGTGGMAETVGQFAMPTLAQPIFGITFGISPFLVGVILMAFRLMDALTDPLMGSISDNARTRWGRRRPFILIGAIGGGVAYAVTFFPPRGLSELAYFSYFICFSLLFYVFYTIFAVPYQALGLAITSDDRQRSGLLAYRGALYQAAGISVAWMYALAQLDVFTDTVQGIRVVAALTGLGFLIAAAVPALVLRERVDQVVAQAKVPFWTSFRLAMSNRPFLLLVAINVLVIVASQMVTHLGLYLKIFYVFEGDTKGGAFIAGVASTAYQISAVATIPVLTYLSARFGKRRAVIACLGCMLAGTFVKWIAYAPGMSYLIPLAAVLVAPGNSAILTTVFSMVGDVVDHDERATGQRREGMYVSVYSWITKLGFSIAGLVSGAILVLSGFRQELAGAQAEGTFLAMRILFVIVPLFSISVAVLVLIRGKIRAPLVPSS